jgi:hypothetical protein
MVGSVISSELQMREENIMIALKRIGRSVLNYLPKREGKVVAKLLDREYLVYRGTIRGTEDYDDAWLLALAYHAHVVVDIGQAAFTILQSDMVRELVLVEANPSALVIAADNLITNGLSTRTRFVPAFASAKDNEMVQFWTVGTGAAGSMYHSHAKTAAAKGSYVVVRWKNWNTQ